MIADRDISRAGLLLRLLACSLMWSSGFLFMKLAGSASPWVLAGSRAGIAASVIAAWFVARGLSPLPERRELVPWLALGTLNGWLPNVLTAYALTQIPAGLSSMIQASGPLMVAVIAHVALADEPLTPRRLAGVLVGFVGMMLLIGPAALHGEGGGALGVLAMAAVSLSYAVGNVIARFFVGFPAERLALGQQTVSAVVALFLMTVLVGAPALGQIAAAWPSILALGVVATAVPITMFMTLILRAGPTRASMIGYLLPVWATLLAIVFLGETVGAREILGATVILFGVWMVSTAPRS
ncbi:DMT family transporter [Alsobacter sp. SYSU M60028]|uniref:DMT family transporter n=1 Tax=Alsobacter ponti TaxID=2962936 RepID=A0ABT1LHY8_9HYPH|nr:DMT family transporter [Alsobacter ponti]MCP8941132.1 DMT family transporter [Alsobacter ponti]